MRHVKEISRKQPERGIGSGKAEAYEFEPLEHDENSFARGKTSKQAGETKFGPEWCPSPQLETVCVGHWRWPNCVEDGLGQVAKLLVARRSCGRALDPRFRVGKVRQDGADGCVGECKNSRRRRVKHENGESEMKRETTCVKHLFHDLEPYVCVTRMKMCEVYADKMCTCYVQKNVRATSECVYTPRRTHNSCYYVGANLYY